MNKIYGTVVASNIKKIGENKINVISMSINKISLKIREKIYQYIGDKEGAILQGIILGDTRKY